MGDSTAVFQPGTRFQTASGTILAGGSIEFYAAGTTDPLTVYSDADLTEALGAVVYLDAGGAPVAEQGSSTKVAVYTGTASFKVVIKDSAGNTIESKDNLKGAFDSASILETLVLIPETEVETLTGADTLTADDIGQLKNCNSTGGAFAVTLPDATALSNGARFGFRMAGSANAVTVKSTGGQTIARAGITSTSFALSRFGETVWLVNDGGNWVEDTYVPPLHNTVGVIAIADRIATPPVSPNAGARYIITSGPTGAWSSYVEHDIVEADGSGGWFRYTPAEDCGWLAYVQDEGQNYQFVGSAWNAMLATPSETAAGLISDKGVSPASLIGYAPGALLGLIEDRKSANTGAGSLTSNAWTARDLNTETYDRLGILSVSSNQFTIAEAGTYEIEWEAPFYSSAGRAKTRLWNATGSAEVEIGTQGGWGGGTGATQFYSRGIARVTIAASTSFEVQYHQSSCGGGLEANRDSKDEIYTRVIIRRG